MKAAKPARPTDEQRRVLQQMLAGDGLIERWDGGFWTTPGQPYRVDRHQGRDYRVPAWSTTVQTVRALEARGWVERAGLYAEAWRDPRRITEAGRLVMAAQKNPKEPTMRPKFRAGDAAYDKFHGWTVQVVSQIATDEGDTWMSYLVRRMGNPPPGSWSGLAWTVPIGGTYRVEERRLYAVKPAKRRNPYTEEAHAALRLAAAAGNVHAIGEALHALDFPSPRALNGDDARRFLHLIGAPKAVQAKVVAQVRAQGLLDVAEVLALISTARRTAKSTAKGASDRRALIARVERELPHEWGAIRYARDQEKAAKEVAAAHAKLAKMGVEATWQAKAYQTTARRATEYREAAEDRAIRALGR